MMGLFNEEQLDHMGELAVLAKTGKLCPCGWFSKAECEKRCNSTCGSPEAQERANTEYRARYPERFTHLTPESNHDQ